MQRYIKPCLLSCLLVSATVSHANFFEPTTTNHPTTSWFVSSIQQRLVSFVHKTVSTVRYTAYKLGGNRFDPHKGVYVLDCSSYVDNILKNIYPQAYSSLVYSTGTDKPTTQHYYDFINDIGEDKKNYWSKVDDAKELKPGDILVFRKKNDRGGHVMVVMDNPHSNDKKAITVQVADSAPSRHSEDTRAPRKSGIGIGTLQLKLDPKTGQPSAYSWKTGCRWKNNVNIAMARPMDVS
jgi:cell wall-associated NlpC family hydrolase